MFSHERERIEILIPREFSRLFHAGGETFPRHDRFDRCEWIAALLPGVDQRSSDLRVETNFVVDGFTLFGKGTLVLVLRFGEEGADQPVIEVNEAYDHAAPVTATLLASLIKIENRDAAAQGYANAAARKYNSLGLSPTLIDQTLSEVQAEAPIYRRYEQVLAEHAARKLGIRSILPAEQDFAYTPSPQISLAEGRQLILDSFQPLGQDYTRRFAALLDPANGRLDLTGGSHRAHTGTSITAYDAAVAFISTGTMDR